MRIEGLRTENELFDSALLFSDVVVFAVVGVVSSANNGFVVVVDNFVVVVVDDVGDNVLDDVVLDAVDSVASVVVFRGFISNVSIELAIASTVKDLKFFALLSASFKISSLSILLFDSASKIAIAAPDCLFRLCDFDCESRVSFASSKRVTLIP